MLNRRCLWCGILLALLVSSPRLEAGIPVVRGASGAVAVQTDAKSEWRVIPVGGILPAVAEARTAAPGASHLQADQGFLALGPLSQIKYDLAARRVELLAGRVFCQPIGDQPWSMQVGPSRVVVAAQSAVEVLLAGESEVTITVLAGTADVEGAGDNQPAMRLAAKETLSVTEHGKKLGRSKLHSTYEDIFLLGPSFGITPAPFPLAQSVGLLLHGYELLPAPCRQKCPK